MILRGWERDYRRPWNGVASEITIQSQKAMLAFSIVYERTDFGNMIRKGMISGFGNGDRFILENDAISASWWSNHYKYPVRVARDPLKLPSTVRNHVANEIGNGIDRHAKNGRTSALLRRRCKKSTKWVLARQRDPKYLYNPYRLPACSSSILSSISIHYHYCRSFYQPYYIICIVIHIFLFGKFSSIFTKCNIL